MSAQHGASAAAARNLADTLSGIQDAIRNGAHLGAQALSLMHRDAAYTALDVGSPAVAMSHALASLELARGTGDLSLQAKAHVTLALVQAETFDDIGAEAQYQKAEVLAREAGDDRGVALVAVNAAHCDIERQKYASAAARLCALHDSRHFQNLNPTDSRGLIVTFHANLVTSASEALRENTPELRGRAELQAQLQRSATLLHRLHERGGADLTGDDSGVLRLAVTEALVRHALWRGDLDAARQLADERVRTALPLGSAVATGRAYLDRARVHEARGEWDGVVRDAELALQSFETGDLTLHSARSRDTLATAYAHLGRYREAFEAQREVTRQVELLYRAYHQQRALVGQVEQQARDAEVRASAFAEAALRDPLTGIPNRTHAMNVLATLHERAQVGATSVVALMDLDHFKQVNDLYGHLTGDLVLTRVAQSILQAVRGADCLARFGGEEFILIFPAVTVQVALEVCERLRALLERLDWKDAAPGLRTSASFGLAVLDGRADVKRTLQAADEALYASKNAGRNRVSVADLNADPVTG